MSNVPPLTDYFRQNHYKKEINLVNPLGRKGEIAEASTAKLLRSYREAFHVFVARVLTVLPRDACRKSQAVSSSATMNWQVKMAVGP